MVSKEWRFHPLFPGRIGIWGCWFLWNGKNGALGENPTEQRQEPTTKSTHINPTTGMESRPHWWKVSALTTALSLLPQIQKDQRNTHQEEGTRCEDLKKHFGAVFMEGGRS